MKDQSFNDSRQVLKESDLILDKELDDWIKGTVEFMMNFGFFTNENDVLYRIEQYLRNSPLPGKYSDNKNYYPLSKLISERIVSRYANGMSVRFPGVYGPGRNLLPEDLEDRLVHKYLSLAKEGKNISYSKVKKNYIYVEDVTDCMLKMAALPLENLKMGERVLNIGSPVHFSCRDIAEIVAGLTDKEIKLIPNSNGTDIPRKVLDMTLAGEIIDFNPCDVTALQEGLRKTWKWLMSNGADKREMFYLSGSGGMITRKLRK